MSVVVGDPVSKSNKAENPVQNSKLNETKKEKKNFCYLCQIQCSGNKNFIEHQKGRKHLKKLEPFEKLIAAENVRCEGGGNDKMKNAKINKVKQNNVKLSRSSQIKELEVDIVDLHNDNNSQSEDSPEAIETMESHSSNQPGNKKFTKSKKYFTNRNVVYPPRNYNSNYYRNPGHYSNYYSEEQPNPYYYERQQYPNRSNQCDYSRWNYPSNTEVGFQQNHNYANIHPFGGKFSNSEHFYQPNYTPGDLSQFGNEEVNQISPNVNDTNGRRIPNSYTSEQDSVIETDNIENSISSLLAEVQGNAEHTDNNTNQPLEKSKVNSDAVQAIGRSTVLSSKKITQSRQSRSRSSVDSSCNNDKRQKDDSENSQEDLDSETEQQKIKDWTNTLLETSHGKISRLIHPSNFKDKAAVNQLITNLAKSKRKENLSRLKLKSDLLCSSGTNDDNKDITEDDNDESVISIEMLSTQDSSNVVQEIQCSGKTNKVTGYYEAGKEMELNNIIIPKKIAKSGEKRKKTSSPRLRKQADSVIPSKIPTRKEDDDIALDKQVKRKSLDALDCKSKKKRLSDAISEPVNIIYTNDKHLTTNSPADESSTSIGDTTKLLASKNNPSDVFALKGEVAETAVEKPLVSEPVNCSTNQQQSVESRTEFSVETLINLFASGSVKVKNEFNDPAIDVIKTVDPKILMNAFSSNSSSVTGNDTERRTCVNSTMKSRLIVPETFSTNEIVQENRNCTSSVTFGSTVVNDNETVGQQHINSLFTSNVANLPTKVSNFSNNNPVPSECSYSGVEGIHFMPKDKSEYTPELKKLIKDLREISSQEEKVKQNLVETKCKINEFQSLLDEWKSKKKMLQDEEEDLRKMRNNIIELMQNACKTTAETSKEVEDNASPTLNSKRQHSSPEPSESIGEPAVSIAKSHHSVNTATSKQISEKKDSETKNSSEFEEISIIPIEIKPEPPELIVIDADDDSPESVSNSDAPRNTNTNPMSNVSNIYEMKNLVVHGTVVNSLVVFEDFVYTCSNDNTAKRFSVKDPTDTVTYLHTGRNVSEVVVEKVQSEALVFTSCTNRVISLFIASNGTRIKSFFQSCAVMSVCKGWGKFYSGLADGTINVYNWKYEEKEVVKTDHSASRIATAHQGRLHVLIILTSNGNISIRDAETGLLIRYIKGFVKLPSWLTVHNDLAYLSSSDKTLTILDILTGRAEKKLYLSNHTTGLSVYDDYVFTISYTGLVNCYNKERVSDRKLYYGAGKNGLTCIYVYQDWVFTGNRKGEVSVFHFDSCSAAACQVSQCCSIFGLKDDLSFHVEKDHITKKKTNKCQWGICGYVFPTYWNIKEKMEHMKKHIYKNLINCVS